MAETGDQKLREAYREPKASDAPGAPPDNVLAYFPESAQPRSSVAFYGVLAPIFGFAAVAAVTGSAGLGLIGLLATAGYMYWKRRRTKTVPRAVLTIQGRMLTLSGEAFSLPRTLAMEALLEVYLDTKAIQRVQENVGAIPALRFLNATVSEEHDTARIGLELEDETLFLTEERVSHLDANEWFSKIRRFLRKHGWLPEDER
jgi:hypothetical protein